MIGVIGEFGYGVEFVVVQIDVFCGSFVGVFEWLCGDVEIFSEFCELCIDYDGCVKCCVNGILFLGVEFVGVRLFIGGGCDVGIGWYGEVVCRILV